MVKEEGLISCDACEYIDVASKFPTVGTPEYDKIHTKFYGQGDYINVGAGIICPACGNVEDFDSNPSL